jgi:hypothetical protein
MKSSSLELLSNVIICRLIDFHRIKINNKRFEGLAQVWWFLKENLTTKKVKSDYDDDDDVTAHLILLIRRGQMRIESAAKNPFRLKHRNSTDQSKAMKFIDIYFRSTEFHTN